MYRGHAAQGLATAERPAPLGAPPGHPVAPWYLKWAQIQPKPLLSNRSYKRAGTRTCMYRASTSRSVFLAISRMALS